MALTIGSPAPPLALTDSTGKPFDLASLAGKRIVLFFYPKADTPGCTTESCEFRDHTAAFVANNAVVIGISPDTEKAQAKFQAKYGLPYALLADSEHAGAEAYGVWKEKSMYGKKYMGVERTTFVIGADGRIEHVFEKVKPAGHAEEVLGYLGQ